jgi:uncharacterized protein YjiS (DUF1127 family)
MSDGSGLARQRGRILRRIRDLLRLWSAREFERGYLATLDDKQLIDMGLTRDDVRREVNEPFWKP